MKVTDQRGNVVVAGQELLWLKAGLFVTVKDVVLSKDGTGGLVMEVALPFQGPPGKHAILGEFVRVVTPGSDAAVDRALKVV